MTQSGGGQLDTVMHESRLFPPSDEFAAKSRIGSLQAYQQLWDEAAQDPVAFWDKLAKEELHWFQPYETTLDWNEPFAKWFVGGQTNASYNCLDAHVEAGRGDRAAILW
ncbi:MAG: acetyl-coenzyme A synthetase, partial [Planctomycetales bacterium]|nr:acetyl-coenzyme A synthetase [Planctomycetales bacterium]